jgi:HAD superfamily hydrolase (TIGR01544 family)
MIKKLFQIKTLNCKFLKMQSSNLSTNYVNDYNPLEKIKIINSDFIRKVEEFKKNKDHLVIITDFDYTLTKKFNKEESLYSSYCVLEFSDMISENYRKLNKELFQKYHPLESDTTLDFLTRDELIKKWFRENLDLLVEENISKEDFLQMVIQAEKKLIYRYGILELFELIQKHSIPIYIISGGIYEIIDESLNYVIPFYKEMKEKGLIHVVSNSFIYGEDNKVVGYKEPFVYTFNKGETLKQIFKETGQHHIILMGDHLNDIDAIKQIEYLEEIKIGFINYFEDSLSEQQSKMVDAYNLHYDVCIINDGNLTFVINLIKKILSQVDDNDENKNGITGYIKEKDTKLI